MITLELTWMTLRNSLMTQQIEETLLLNESLTLYSLSDLSGMFAYTTLNIQFGGTRLQFRHPSQQY